MRSINPAPDPAQERSFRQWLRDMVDTANGNFDRVRSDAQFRTRPVMIPVYSINDLPDPALTPVDQNAPQGVTSMCRLIAISDETGGFTLAVSDGTNWLRMQDRAVAS